MQTQVCEVGTPEAQGVLDGEVRDSLKFPSVPSTTVLGDASEVQLELDSMLADVCRFHLMEPDQVMQYIAAYSARLTELDVRLSRLEGRNRTYKVVRIEVDRVYRELDRQMRLASRQITSRGQEIDLSR